MSFEKLDKKELLRTADEDFAVEVDPSMTKKQIIEALGASGVTFPMYLEANPALAEELSVVPENVVVDPLVPPAVVDEPSVIPADVVVPKTRKILVKMVRDNPLFEIGKYRWTQKHPYVAVDEKDAEHILINEHGFRQATPGELQEYYS